MSSTHCTNRMCSFIPPYMLKHISNSPHVAVHDRVAALQSLSHTFHYQAKRASHLTSSRPDGSGFIPGFMLRNLAGSDHADKGAAQTTLDSHTPTKKEPTSLTANREIHDMAHNDKPSHLPGKLIKSDANPSTASVERTITDCFDNLGLVYKFYADVFGRDSIDDKGMCLIGSVHYGKNYENAFWDSTEMVFGDGGTFLYNFTKSLDVVGHELTHGVTERSAALVYHGQAGALNESISDVFGSMISQYHAKQSSAEADWLIGEDCVLPTIKGLALRSMKAPGTAYDDPRIGKDPQPAHMRDYKNLADTEDQDWGGVHTNSGIPNRAFYLVATGLGGNSWDKAGPIWYKTVTGDKITNKCDFKNFAQITCEVAGSVFGEKEKGVVEGAWKEVGVLE